MKKMLLSLSALLLTLPMKAQSPSGYNEQEAVSLMKTIQGTPLNEPPTLRHNGIRRRDWACLSIGASIV